MQNLLEYDVEDMVDKWLRTLEKQGYCSIFRPHNARIFNRPYW